LIVFHFPWIRQKLESAAREALHGSRTLGEMLHGSGGSKVVPLSVQHQGGGKMKAFWIDDSGGEHTVAGHPNRMTKVK
jgi:hypothetical protein